MYPLWQYPVSDNHNLPRLGRHHCQGVQTVSNFLVRRFQGCEQHPHLHPDTRYQRCLKTHHYWFPYQLPSREQCLQGQRHRSFISRSKRLSETKSTCKIYWLSGFTFEIYLCSIQLSSLTTGMPFSAPSKNILLCLPRNKFCCSSYPILWKLCTEMSARSEDGAYFLT